MLTVKGTEGDLVMCETPVPPPISVVHSLLFILSGFCRFQSCSFTNDVLPIKIRDEFMVGVASWRGIGKRNVTG